MRAVAERAWFALSRAFGQLLRAGRYTDTRIVRQNGNLRVRKRRRSYAPLLVSLGNPLMRLLDTGVRVLPQREWEQRELWMYQRNHGLSASVDRPGALDLPWLRGQTLAAVLENPALGEPVRRKAMTLAAHALAEFHRRGFTHGDAMADNVMVDLEAGAAHWFDFETIHDPSRSMTWRRADDARALLTTCVARTPPDGTAAVVGILLDAYDDDAVTRLLARQLASLLRRPLAFHLGQARLSLRSYRELARTLRARVDERPGTRQPARA